MQVLKTLSEMIQWRRSSRGKLGFVPTMGALHEGHATLLRNARAVCDQVVLSIFVNPTQFAPHEDLSRYPRPIETDLEIARLEGVDAVFFPTVEQIYPPGFSTYVEETEFSLPLCGKFRPGHFRGVTTVVLKLFHLVKPDTAFFGLKDAQQFIVLEKMVQDLNLDIEMVGVPTVREPDGLALSSRNIYLSTTERAIAPLLYQELLRARDGLSSSLADENVKEVLENSVQTLESQGFQVQYLDYLPLSGHSKFGGLIAVAAYLGKTRLIDNILIWL